MVQDVGRDYVQLSMVGVCRLRGHYTDQQAVAAHRRTRQPSPRGSTGPGPLRGLLEEVHHVPVLSDSTARVQPATQLDGFHGQTRALGDIRYAPRLTVDTGPVGDQTAPTHRGNGGGPTQAVIDEDKRCIVSSARRTAPHHGRIQDTVPADVEHLNPPSNQVHTPNLFADDNVGGGQHQPPTNRISRPWTIRPGYTNQTRPLHPELPFTPPAPKPATEELLSRPQRGQSGMRPDVSPGPAGRPAPPLTNRSPPCALRGVSVNDTRWVRPRETAASVSAPTAHSLNPALAFASARTSTSNSISTGPTENTTSGCSPPSLAAAISSSRTAATASTNGMSTEPASSHDQLHRHEHRRAAIAPHAGEASKSGPLADLAERFKGRHTRPPCFTPRGFVPSLPVER